MCTAANSTRVTCFAPLTRWDYLSVAYSGAPPTLSVHLHVDWAGSERDQRPLVRAHEHRLGLRVARDKPRPSRALTRWAAGYKAREPNAFKCKLCPGTQWKIIAVLRALSDGSLLLGERNRSRELQLLAVDESGAMRSLARSNFRVLHTPDSTQSSWEQAARCGWQSLSSPTPNANGNGKWPSSA